MGADGDQLLALAVRIQVLASGHQRIAATVLAQAGVDASAAGLMWVLAVADQPLAMGAIAERLDCDPSNVTLLRRRLQSIGYVEQQADPLDRRKRLLALTGPGRRVAEAMIETVTAQSPLASLSAETLKSLEHALDVALGGGAQQAVSEVGDTAS